MRNTFRIVPVLLALASAAFAGISVSSPTSGATVGSPVHVTATASSSNPITAMAVYLDNNMAYSVNGSSVNTYVSASAGSHSLVIQSWDSYGNVQKQPVTINVATSSGVSVSSPSAGATVGSPFNVAATAQSSSAISAMAVYVDSSLAYKVSGGSLNTSVSASAGSHYVVVQAWDSYGNVLKQALTVNVSGGSGSTAPSNATVYSNIDQMTGWASCNSCAGPGGKGASVPYSMTQFETSPSLDGKSAEFWLGGTTPYSAALWWKQLGANGAVSNFVYDLYFYVKNPSASQALEFDMNQSGWGKKWIFGTQCDYNNHKDWDVWDTANSVWVQTGIPCNRPQAYVWNHLVLEFQRTSTGMAKFVAVTLNGTKSYINKSFWPQGSSVQELNVAFQMDGNGSETNYSVWLDKVNMSAW